jgi:large subunit ribosomal protein L5
MTEDGYVPRLRQRFREEVVPQLQQQLGLPNVMQVPRLEKVVVNMGVGEAIKDGRLLDAAIEDLQTVTGQRPVVTKARKSIAGFKLFPIQRCERGRIPGPRNN